jgi:hypothetical protein
MQKLILLSTIIAITGCATITPNSQNTLIKYEQDGTTCNYIEEYGEFPLEIDKNYEYTEMKAFILRNRREVQYANTNCTKIIDEDMKNTDKQYSFYKSSLHSGSLERESVVK